MRTQIPLLFCLAVVAAVALSGCLSNQGTTTASYSNDVVTVEDYYVYNLQPEAGSETTISFLVQNNGEDPVTRVKVNFDSNLEITGLECSGTTAATVNSGERYCVFDSTNDAGVLQPFDTRHVELTIKAPSRDIILKATTFQVSYSIEYDYSGYRTVSLPVIDDSTESSASSEYSQSEESYGPVLLSFKLQARGTHTEDGETVEDYWGVKGDPFKVVFGLTDVASSDMKATSPVVNAGKLKLDTKGSLNITDGMPCDFEQAADGYMYSTKAVKMPGELRCSFESYDFPEPEVLATIWAEYGYTYGYTLTEKFQVQPVGES